MAATLGWTSDEKLILIALMSALNPIGAVCGALIGGFIGSKLGRR